MSIAADKARIEDAKDSLRTFLQGRGVTVQSSDKIHQMVSMLAQLPNAQGILQTKEATPTTGRQEIVPDTGYDALARVSVLPIETETKTVTAGTDNLTVFPTSGKFLTQITVKPTPSQTKTTTPSTQAQTVTPDNGKYLSSVEVSAVPTETKSVSPSTQARTITPTNGKFLSSVTVSAIQTEEKTAVQNGFVTPTNGKYLSRVTVNVQPVLQEKTATGNGTILPDSGYAGLSKVYVQVPDNSEALYQEKSITPTTQMQTVYPDSGYAALSGVTISPIQTETKTVTAGTDNIQVSPTSGKFLTQVTVHPTPSQTKTVTPSSQALSVTPDSGKLLSSVTVSAVQTETKSASPSTQAQTITPSNGKFLSSVTVSAIQTETKSISENGTYTPSSGKFFSSVSVNVPSSGGNSGGNLPSVITAGDTPVLYAAGAYQSQSTTLTNTGLTLNIPQAGTYRFRWLVSGGGGSRYTVKSQLYRNGTAVGTQQTSQGSDAYSLDLACSANDQVTLYLAGYNYGGYFGGGGGLCACINWDNGF